MTWTTALDRLEAQHLALRLRLRSPQAAKMRSLQTAESTLASALGVLRGWWTPLAEDEAPSRGPAAAWLAKRYRRESA